MCSLYSLCLDYDGRGDIFTHSDIMGHKKPI